MRIELHIERVILRGLPVGDPAEVERALIAELTGLLAAAPARSWQESRRQRRIIAPPLSPLGTDRRDASAGLGRDLAHSVFHGIAGGAR